MTVDAIIASDACFRGEDLSRFSSGDAAGVFSDLLGDFGTADLSTVNLERPLADPSPRVQERLQLSKQGMPGS